MSRRRDEDGIFQIVEAVLVAVLVAGALIFFALVQKPAGGSTSEGQDLAQAAADALDILGHQTPSLRSLIDDYCMTGSAGDASDVRAAVAAVLPAVSFQVRIDDGPNTSCTRPNIDSTTGGVPSNAQAAIAYVLDDDAEVAMVQLVVWNGF